MYGVAENISFGLGIEISMLNREENHPSKTSDDQYLIKKTVLAFLIKESYPMGLCRLDSFLLLVLDDVGD